MMRCFRPFIFLLFFLGIFTSCSKTNDSPSDGQLVAGRLKRDLGETIGKTAVVFNYSNGSLQYQGKISELGNDGMITISGDNTGDSRMYNLASLVLYSINSTGAVYLYF